MYRVCLIVLLLFAFASCTVPAYQPNQPLGSPLDFSEDTELSPLMAEFTLSMIDGLTQLDVEEALTKQSESSESIEAAKAVVARFCSFAKHASASDLRKLKSEKDRAALRKLMRTRQQRKDDRAAYVDLLVKKLDYTAEEAKIEAEEVEKLTLQVYRAHRAAEVTQ